MKDLVWKVEKWFYQRELDSADPTKQVLKLMEEVGELAEGIVKDDRALVIDSIGDIQVVLIGLALQLDLDYEDCLEHAYNEIADRKGKVINGVFVKEEDIKDKE